MTKNYELNDDLTRMRPPRGAYTDYKDSAAAAGNGAHAPRACSRTRF